MAGESQAPPKAMPDPSVMATEAVDRAVDGLAEVFDAKLDVIRERLNGIDKATALLDTQVNRVPTETQEAVGHLKELMGERFDSVGAQFTASKESADKLGELFNTSVTALSEKVDDLKDRLAKTESALIGMASNRAGGKETLTGLYSLIGIIATILAIMGVLAASGVFSK